jgi:hypothetical protein
MCSCPMPMQYTLKGTAFLKMTLHEGELHVKIDYVRSYARLIFQTV